MPTVIPAYSFFSTVSQEQANQDAIDAVCPSACCVSLLTTIANSFPVFLTYDNVDNLVFFESQVTGIHAIDPTTDTIVGTQFVPGSMYIGGIIYAEGFVYACVNPGAGAVWRIVNPLSMAVTGTVTPPAGHTFLAGLQPYYDSTAGRIIVAGRQTTPSREAILQIDLASGVASVLLVAGEGFSAWDWPGTHDPTRNRFVQKRYFHPTTSYDLVIYSAAFAVVGTKSLGAASLSGNTGDALYVPDVDKIFFSGKTGAGDEFWQLNADTLATEFVINATSGSIWSNPNCSIVFQRTSGSVVQWDYASETLICTQPCAGFGFGATAETVTGKCYVCNGFNVVQVLAPPP